MKRLIKLLIVTAFFNALSWIILIPVWQYPDEQAHFAQVQDIAEIGKIPADGLDTSWEIALSEKILGTERDGFGNNKYTYHPKYKIDYSPKLNVSYESEIASLPTSSRTQLVKKEATHNPPLYYFMGSIIYRIFYNTNLFTRVYVIRLMSASIFLGSIILAYKIGKLIFEKNSILIIALTALVAFKPMLVYSSTGILPDTLTNILFSAILFLSIKILKEGFKRTTLLLIGMSAIFGFLTRQQFLIALFPALLATIYTLCKETNYIKKFLLFLASLILFFYFTNTHGTTLPFFNNFRLADISIFRFENISLASFFSHQLFTIRHTALEVWPWYLGVYKWLSLTLPPIYYQIINRIVIISVIGLLLRVLVIIKDKKIREIDLHLVFLFVISLLYYLVLTVWEYFFWLKNGFYFGIQGRYFFPLVVAHLAILLTGLVQIFKLFFKNYASYLVLLLVPLMIIFNDLSLFHVSSSYYDATNFKTFVLQASQYKPLFFKGYIILIIPAIAITLQMAFIVSLVRYSKSINESN